MTISSPDYGRIVSVLQAIGTILAIRFFLMLAVIGSIGLAFVAMPQTDAHGIFVLIAYNSLTVLPLVFLSTKGK